jgi:hypothetical protein
VEDGIKARCAALHRAGDGVLVQTDAVPVDGIESPAKLYEELVKGAVWTGGKAQAGTLRCELKSWPAAAVVESPPGWTGHWCAAVLPPLAAKLFQESSLREAPARRQV